MNWISLTSEENSFDEIPMSNGLTAVFITTFGLSATIFAETETQKALTVFMLEKDQSCVGRGNVGFALSELPWRRQTFKRDKEFLLQALSGIKEELGWQTLNYEPEKELLFPVVDRLIHLTEQLTEELIEEAAAVEWLMAAKEDDPIVTGFPRCEEHQLLLSLYGCHACNDK